jgi:hypothetical protein
MVWVLGRSRLRIGEAIALHRCDIGLAAGLLRVVGSSGSTTADDESSLLGKKRSQRLSGKNDHRGTAWHRPRSSTRARDSCIAAPSRSTHVRRRRVGGRRDDVAAAGAERRVATHHGQGAYQGLVGHCPVEVRVISPTPSLKGCLMPARCVRWRRGAVAVTFPQIQEWVTGHPGFGTRTVSSVLACHPLVSSPGTFSAPPLTQNLIGTAASGHRRRTLDLRCMPPNQVRLRRQAANLGGRAQRRTVGLLAGTVKPSHLRRARPSHGRGHWFEPSSAHFGIPRISGGFFNARKGFCQPTANIGNQSAIAQDRPKYAFPAGTPRAPRPKQETHYLSQAARHVRTLCASRSRIWRPSAVVRASVRLFARL